MYVALGDKFLYTYFTAAHYSTVLDISNGLKKVGTSYGDVPFEHKPGAAIEHSIILEAVQCGIQTITETTVLRDGRHRSTKTTTITVVSPQCVMCKKEATQMCPNCLESYCSVECQKKDWEIGHKIKCTGVFIFDASGYLIGTSHHVKIENGIYVSSGKRSTNMTTVLSPEQQEKLCSILRNNEGVFHARTKSDTPQGGDMGASRFIFNGLYANPQDIPELCQFLLEIDPQLANSPGGIFVK